MNKLWALFIAVNLYSVDSLDLNIFSQKIFKMTLKSLSISVGCIALSVNAGSNLVPELGQCISESNPQTTTITCRQVGLVDGRIRGCNANENCFSTSASSATKRLSPRHYTSNEDDTFLILRTAIQSENLKILKTNPNIYYVLAAEKNLYPNQPSGSSIFYEFMLKPEDKVILYRGVIDKSIFVYPLQQPVSDFNVIKNKMNIILSKCGLEEDEIDYMY